VSDGVLIAGYGLRGRQWHAAVAARRGCHVAGVADPDERARAEARASGLAAWASLNDALAETKARAAVVATPPQLHRAHALACLAADLDVLVEKPLALSVEDAAAVAGAATAARRVVVVGHNFRHRPLERALMAAIADGRVGSLRSVSIATARPAHAPAHELPRRAPLWDLGVHHLDLLRLRLGRLPDAVEAREHVSADGLTYTVRMEWEGEATADYWLREGASVYNHAEWLEGPLGALRTLDRSAWLVTPTRRPRRLRLRRGPQPESVLLDALLGAADSAPVGARDALGTIAMVEAAIRSLTLERRVRVDELFTGAEAIR
jgi:predicted dehydrogenase